MYAKRYTVTVTTAADGTATAYTDEAINGPVYSIQYVKTDYANGVDFAITGETTGLGLWTESDVNASTVRAPRQSTHSQVGAALLYAAGGANVSDFVYLSGERIKFVLAQGGATKVGTFYVTVG